MGLNGIINFFFPSLLAHKSNKMIQVDSDNKLEIFEEKKTEWTKNFRNDTNTVAPMVQDIYTTESQMKRSHESKARTLLSSMGIVLSLISIFFTTFKQSWISNYLMLLFLFLLSYSIINFLLSGLCAAKSLRLGEFYIPNIDVFKNCLELNKNDSSQNWIAEKITNIEMNTRTLLMRSNWLDAAQSHFMYGIYLLSAIFLLLIINIVVR